METYGIRYLGSKRLLVDNILQVIKEKAPETKSVIDVFSGTTRVAQYLRQNGFIGVASDLSWATEIYAQAFLQNKNNSHLQKYIDELNSLVGYRDWITNNYCDIKIDGDKRVRVWQEKNGMRADAIRNKINTYSLEPWEKGTLIISLIFALSSVDNTIGIQQAYLKDWCSRSYNDLILFLPPSLDGPIWNYISGDALLIDYPTCDVAYIDPPYTGAVYSTYYHIWDSIARWDKPKTSLKTNRREDRSFTPKNEKADRSMQSPWNYKKEAKNAFIKLFDRLPVKHLVISYSNESYVSKEEMFEIFSKYKNVELKEFSYKRNVMAKIGAGANDNAIMDNIEYIFYATKI
jgi:adenine-specific DNA-methyltransferase